MNKIVPDQSFDVYKPSARKRPLLPTDYGNVSLNPIPNAKWRGLFAQKNFKAGDFILSAPVLPISPEEREHIQHTRLNHYLFCWLANDKGIRVPPSAGWVAMAFGLTNMLNHSVEGKNCYWLCNYGHMVIDVFAARTIRRGEELLFDYELDETSDSEASHIETLTVK